MMMKIETMTEVRPQPIALTISPTVNMPTEVRLQRVALTISPTVNMPKGMLRLE
jgi:hypothetical protein